MGPLLSKAMKWRQIRDPIETVLLGIDRVVVIVESHLGFAGLFLLGGHAEPPG
jgi:hypothetical protein